MNELNGGNKQYTHTYAQKRLINLSLDTLDSIAIIYGCTKMS